MLAATCLSPPTVSAAEMLSLKVKREGQRYFVASHARIDAPIEAVYNVLIDYDRLHELTSTFEETRVVEGAEDEAQRLVYLRARGCVAFFCKTIVRYDRLELERPRDIVAVAVPAPTSSTEGDSESVAYSYSHWELSEEEDGTHVLYSMEMEPPFWVPPLVGPWAVKRKLASGAGDAAQRVEQRALGLPVVLD